jgi:Tol biopolymer transport system component
LQNLTPRSRVGPYEIGAPIGAGGMGEVFRARDTRLKREVALKVLPDAFASDTERMARFQREAEILASLNHPNIAQIYGVEDAALAMEFVEGSSPQGPLPFEDAWEIAMQIADALRYAHERGIIHRDLKPDNVKVTPDGNVKLLDFGLAKAFDDPSDHPADPANSPTLTLDQTKAGVVLGTAAYMSPEQAKGKRIDQRADIWSWGVVLYELLTGEPLFAGASVAESLSNVLTRVPDLNRVPPQVRRVLARALDKDPRARLRDIGDARYLLDDAPEPLAAAGRPRFARAAWIAAAACALVGAALGYVAVRHAREEEPRVVRLFLPPPPKTTYAVQVGIPAVSPDGRKIAFVGTREGRNALWVRTLDELAARELPGTDDARYPFWSPDSAAIAFFAGGKLKRIAAQGGPVLNICEAPFGFGGAWGPKNVIVLAPTLGGGLFRVDAGGGDPTPVTELNKSAGEISHRFPWFLPDGRRVLFTARNVIAAKTTISLAEIDAKGHRNLATAISNAAFGPPGRLLFMKETNLLAQSFDAAKGEMTGPATAIAEEVFRPSAVFAAGQFSISQNGVLAYLRSGPERTQLTWFDRSGKTLGTVGAPAETVVAAISPDEKSVVVDRRDPQTSRWDIWTYNLAGGGEARITFGDGDSIRPVWSHDGRRIAFTNNRGGLERIVTKPFGGATPEEMLDEAPFGVRASDWSRDGRYVIERRISPGTNFDVWVLPTFGDRKAFPFADTDAREEQGRLSPDGRWLAYVATSPNDEIYVKSFPQPADKRQVSRGGGSRPIWSPDGKALFYLAYDGRMMEVRVTSGPSGVEFGIPAPLFSVNAPPPTEFQMDRKGRFLIPVQLGDSANAPLTVVLNWPSAVKQ